MSEKRQFRAIKGTRDILPPDSALWNRFEQSARNIFESYGFGEIRLPIFEETDLFARSIGSDTDVVGKEMYTFEDRDESSVSLRPEATASVARAYIEHGMHTLPGNVKLYYIGPMFRRERPQKGRYRQFYQIGAEVLGQSDAPAIDAEVLEMLVVLFKRAGLAGTALYVNSIGCKECRPKYVELLREELRKLKDGLGPDSQRRIETNPLRVLDSKVPAEQPIIEKLPRISDHLCADCRAHFAKLKEELNLRGIAIRKTGASSAAWTITRAPHSKSPRLVSGRRTPYAAAAAMTDWSNCSAALLPKASASRSARTAQSYRCRRAKMRHNRPAWPFISRG